VVSSVAWLPFRRLPQFLTAGGDGLLLWSLRPAFLEQRSLTIPDLGLGVACTAVCTAASSGDLSSVGSLASTEGKAAADDLSPQAQAAAAVAAAGGSGVLTRLQLEASQTAFVADQSGSIWQVAVGEWQQAGRRLQPAGPGTTPPPAPHATALPCLGQLTVLAAAVFRNWQQLQHGVDAPTQMMLLHILKCPMARHCQCMQPGAVSSLLLDAAACCDTLRPTWQDWALLGER
jgi:hypothetical protein